MVVGDGSRRPPVVTILALIVVGLAVLAGAMYFRRGESGPKPTPVPAAPTSPPHPAAAEKQRIVSEFYDDVAAQRYLQAYQLLSPDLQHEQPYDEFIHRYDGVQRFEVQSTDEPGTARAHVTVVVHRAGVRTTGLAGEVAFAYDASNARWIIGERHLARQWGPPLGAVATAKPVAPSTGAARPGGLESPSGESPRATDCYQDAIAKVDRDTRIVTMAQHGDRYRIEEGVDWSTWSGGDPVSVCLAADSGYMIRNGKQTVNASEAAP
jgi:hypothetical protein